MVGDTCRGPKWVYVSAKTNVCHELACGLVIQEMRRAAFVGGSISR